MILYISIFYIQNFDFYCRINSTNYLSYVVHGDYGVHKPLKQYIPASAKAIILAFSCLNIPINLKLKHLFPEYVRDYILFHPNIYKTCPQKVRN